MAGETEQVENPLAVSDEDFLNQVAPPADSDAQTPENQEQEEQEEDTNESVNDSGEEKNKDDPVSDSGIDDDPGVTKDDEPKPKPGAEGEGEGDGAKSDEAKPGEESDAEPKTDPEDKTKDDPKADPKADPKDGKPASADDKSGTKDGKSDKVALEPVTNEVAQDFYQKMMKPFRANGKDIQLRTPEEAMQLMQMGANYTKKLQEIQPHRKTLMMLQKNDILDPDRLSFLIDLDKGDPEAIKKLLKDKNIDPLDIDISTDSEYTGGGNSIDDVEVKFRTTMDEVTSLENGPATIQEINSKWDKASIDVLWENPEIISIIHEQRANGIYDTITAEMDRRITLGQIKSDTPFLESYKLVGDELAKTAVDNDGGAADESGDSTKDTPADKTAAEPLATKVAAPKTKVANDEQAKSLAPTRTTPTQQREKVNPLSMSDDEFLKQMENRL